MGIGGGDWGGGGFIFWSLTLNHIVIYVIMKDHRKKKEKRASELIRLDMKEKETVRAREEER